MIEEPKISDTDDLFVSARRWVTFLDGREEPFSLGKEQAGALAEMIDRLIAFSDIRQMSKDYPVIEGKTIHDNDQFKAAHESLVSLLDWSNKLKADAEIANGKAIGRKVAEYTPAYLDSLASSIDEHVKKIKEYITDSLIDKTDALMAAKRQEPIIGEDKQLADWVKRWHSTLNATDGDLTLIKENVDDLIAMLQGVTVALTGQGLVDYPLVAEPASVTESCFSCRYFRSSNGDGYYCLHSPPSVVGIGGGDWVSVSVKTTPDNWCGQYKVVDQL